MNLPSRFVVFSAVLLCLPLVALSAGNTNVYRCGQTYQQSPCPAGKEVNVADEREASQQAEAKKALASDRALARELEAERRQREKSVKPQTHAVGVPVSPGPAAQSADKPSADPCKSKGGKSGTGKKLKCVDGSPLYSAPADAVGKSSAR
ncbi:MAG: hypothetical protein KA185_08585 [Vitreoscilla sp.]|nr:hypothetical protein [Vitreoscilla sp.]